MTNVTGQILRMIGLLIEMFGVWGVYTAADGQPAARIVFPGGRSVPLAWFWPWGWGLVVWLLGTAMVYSSRRRRRTAERDVRRMNLE